VVLDNKDGRILAMAGAFSYPLSQLNRVTQTQRQPGSALKPLTFLAALHNGLQPNTLVEDEPITLPPVGSTRAIVRDAYGSILRRDYEQGAEGDSWTPKNFDGTYSGLLTLRQGLERSRNVVTARLLDGGIDGSPERSLAQVCSLAVAAKLYKECVPHYPFVLGAQPVRLIDLAAFYAAVSNEGAYRRPYAIESVARNGRTLYRHKAESPVWLASGDRAAFYQLKSILQGVLLRGTATPIKHLARYVAGKTGTSDDGNDAWFVGFTNDVTVAVWVGYDNGDGKRRTLGGSQTGAKVAIPIFEPIMESVWSLYAPKVALSPPSAAARMNLVAVPINYATGDVIEGTGASGFTEYLRRDPSGHYVEAQYRIVSRYQADFFRDRSHDYQQGNGYPPGYPPGFYPRGMVRTPDGWIDSEGRRYREMPPTAEAPPPQRRGFLDELFGIFRQPQQREPYEDQRAERYGQRADPYGRYRSDPGYRAEPRYQPDPYYRADPSGGYRRDPYGWRSSPYN
jgi:membrane carboxypeptidase/penicillin-binding protein